MRARMQESYSRCSPAVWMCFHVNWIGLVAVLAISGCGAPTSGQIERLLRGKTDRVTAKRMLEDLASRDLVGAKRVCERVLASSECSDCVYSECLVFRLRYPPPQGWTLASLADEPWFHRAWLMPPDQFGLADHVSLLPLDDDTVSAPASKLLNCGFLAECHYHVTIHTEFTTRHKMNVYLRELGSGRRPQQSIRIRHIAGLTP
jgi:hypothetical protein